MGDKIVYRPLKQMYKTQGNNSCANSFSVKTLAYIITKLSRSCSSLSDCIYEFHYSEGARNPGTTRASRAKPWRFGLSPSSFRNFEQVCHCIQILHSLKLKAISNSADSDMVALISSVYSSLRGEWQLQFRDNRNYKKYLFLNSCSVTTQFLSIMLACVRY